MTLRFGGHSVAAEGFVASLSASDGTVTWARELGSSVPGIGTREDQVFFAGGVIGNVDLGGGLLGAGVSGDAVFGGLSSSGEYEFGRRFGGLDRDTASEVEPTSVWWSHGFWDLGRGYDCRRRGVRGARRTSSVCVPLFHQLNHSPTKNAAAPDGAAAFLRW